MKVITAEEKQARFDLYWQTRDLGKADLRSQQRSRIAYTMLSQKSGKLLDVGCGRGWNSAFFSQKGYKVEAVDISPEAVEITRQRGSSARVLDLEQDEISGNYDVILCLEVLQFLVDPLKVLLKLKSVLNDRGELIISLPNEFHLLRRLKILFGRPNFGGYEALHLRLFYPAEVSRLIKNAGLKIMACCPVSIIPPDRGLLSETGDLLARLWPGLFSLYLVIKAVRASDE